LAINELSVVNKICMIEKGQIRRENRQIQDQNSLSRIYKEGGIESGVGTEIGCQRATETYELSSGEDSGRQDSEIKLASGGTLTCCREGLVRTAKYSQQVRDTHVLSSIERGTHERSENKPEGERHSLPVRRREEIHQYSERKPASGGKLTSCRAQSEGVVRTAKEILRTKSAHKLSSAWRWTRQDSKRMRASEEHSQTAKRRGRDKSEQRNKPSGRGVLTSCRVQSEESSGQRHKANERGVLTPYQTQSKGVVRTAKKSQPARGTYILSSAERGSRQDSETTPVNEGYSPTVERRARESSGQRYKAGE
jgi:hypothetical protein